jgi:hypothetical protein
MQMIYWDRPIGADKEGERERGEFERERGREEIGVSFQEIVTVS